jgi:hypothetical protein
MGRWLIAVGLLLVVSSRGARAESCTCHAGPWVLPAEGSIDVPRNTRIWVLDPPVGPGAIEDGDATAWRGNGVTEGGAQRFDLDRLAGTHTYRFQVERGPSTQFVTRPGDDTAAPAPPAVRALALAVSEYGPGTTPVVDVTLDAALDPDVVLLRVTLTSHDRTVSRILTPQGLMTLGRAACNTELPFAAGDHVSVAISAIDLAGNESAPAVRAVEVGRAPASVPACARPYHVRCGLHLVALVYLGALVGVFLCSLLAFVWIVRRRRAVHPGPIESVSLLVAEQLARWAQRRGGIIAAIGIVGVPALVAMDEGVFAIASTIVGCVGLRGFCVARSVLQLIEPAAERRARLGDAAGPATAEVCGSALLVRSADDEAHLEITPRALAAARRHAVPTSIAKRS